MWFREDLRLDDNPALRAAVDSGKPVLCVYVLDDDAEDDFALGGAQRWWLHHSLGDLSAGIDKAGSRLILRRGNAEKAIKNLVKESGACGIYWNRRYAPYQVKLDKTLKSDLQDDGIEVVSCNGRLIYEPWEIETKSGDPYRVYTPFWRSMKQKNAVRDTLPGVRKLDGPSDYPKSDELDDWNLLPSKPNWATGFDAVWSPGEKGAREKLRDFLDGPASAYKSDRDRPDKEATSRLSPHLHFGEISPVQVWHAVTQKREEGSLPDSQAETYLGEIGWREFSYTLIYNNPRMFHSELQEKFRGFPWSQSEKNLKAWQQGRTGYPIVDAGMRQLWQTGWMHNRIRMVVGSFLVKHLLIDWREGMHWFWDTLVDADEGNNTAQWQWIAGCGADAQPFFRIFNPMTQGEKFDPDGTYVRSYVEELKDMPAKHIHTPWEAPDDVLRKAGVTLGETYPEPIVDHKPARERALDAYNKIK